MDYVVYLESKKPQDFRRREQKPIEILTHASHETNSWQVANSITHIIEEAEEITPLPSQKISHNGCFIDGS